MNIKIHDNIGEIPVQDWNSLVTEKHPFLRHEFLNAMELHGCVGERLGWQPRHICIYEKDRLIGAMPLYEKYNSYGEFVFDNAWADAYERHGLRYFPKLVAAIPYTPAAGQRLLIAKNRFSEIVPVLIKTALKLTGMVNASSFHCLFPLEQEIEYYAQQKFYIRHDAQFHWHGCNPSPADRNPTSIKGASFAIHGLWIPASLPE